MSPNPPDAAQATSALGFLKHEVRRVRAAIVSVPPNEWSTELLRDFPSGSCGDASYLLAAHLIDSGVVDLVCVVAREQGHWLKTHVWLEHNGVVLDITAGQYSDAPSEVIVTSSSPWHQRRFEVEERDSADFRTGNPQGFELLHGDYARLCKSLR